MAVFFCWGGGGRLAKSEAFRVQFAAMLRITEFVRSKT